MADISVQYMGLSLKSPIIAASCGMTADYEIVSSMDKMGIGAVVVKSLFEEQINNEVDFVSGVSAAYPDMENYLHVYMRQYSISQYIDKLRKIRFATSVPVIASVNCYHPGEWVSYAKEMEGAGADGLEINIYDIPLSVDRSSEDIENEYLKVIKSIVDSISIPVAVKLSTHFTNIPAFVNSLAKIGVKGVVLFNRFYNPDIDLSTMQIVPAPTLSEPTDYLPLLRWTAILSSLVKGIDISATTGLYNPSSAVKQILFGAKTVQICSVIYREGLASIAGFNSYLRKFMDEHNINTLSEMAGMLNYSNVGDPDVFERVQFIKSFGGYK